jgi:hypothetical protein
MSIWQMTEGLGKAVSSLSHIIEAPN